MYNLLGGGAAGLGVETTTEILERFLKHAGCGVFTMRDLMSRIRGGHNFSRIRFGEQAAKSHTEQLDGIIALDAKTIPIHQESLQPEGFILCDSNTKTDDPRAISIDMKGIATALGNVRAAGSVAVGAALKLFGFPLDEEDAFAVLNTALEPKLVDVNVKAALAGYAAVSRKFDTVSGNFAECMIVSGNIALALGAMAAGLQFYAAYPMSPSTSILAYISQKADALGIVAEQAEDEIAAINLAIGASFAGGRAMTGTSGGGFSLMVESLGLSGIAEIPLVVVDVQRPGPATGLPTRTEQSDLKFVISASQGEFPRMVIALRHHEDVFHQTKRAFDMAQKYQIPVILLSDQYLADATATIPVQDVGETKPDLPEELQAQGEYARYRFTDSGISPRIIPGDKRGFAAADSDEHDQFGHIIEGAQSRVQMMDKRMRKLELIKQDLQEPELLGEADPDILLLGWGSLYGPLEEAVRILNTKGGKKYGALVFGDIWPLPHKLLEEMAAKAKTVINVEQNYTGQLASLVREVTGIKTNASILKYDGRQISGNEIALRVTGEGF